MTPSSFLPLRWLEMSEPCRLRAFAEAGFGGTQGFNKALKSTMAALRKRAMSELSEMASVSEMDALDES